MALIKEFLTGTSRWLRSRRFATVAGRPEVDEDGLICGTLLADPPSRSAESPKKTSEAIIRPAPVADRRQPLETLQQGFDDLVGQLRGINGHLDRQMLQHEELMRKLEELPQALDDLPAVVDGHRQLTEQLVQQLNASTAKDRQFSSSLQQIEAESGRQSGLLDSIDDQLAVAAQADRQMVQGFNRFHDMFREASARQTDGILQMGETLAVGDRRLQYIITKQHERFTWLFLAAMGTCLTAIISLLAVVVYLAR